MKQYWSQALSGFANTEGGVLIWGIRAARITSPNDPSRTVDAASELDLAPQPETFLQSLKDQRLEATVDPVQGVEFQSYRARTGNGGFVVCLIPEGGNKPYRAALDPAKQYYQRVGDSFVVIPHALLRSLFYPRGSPVFAIDVTAEHRNGNGKLTLSVVNVGNATAREIYLVQNKGKLAWASIWSPIRNADRDPAGFVCETPLHPGQSLDLGSVPLKHDDQIHGDFYEWRPIALQFTAYASDHLPQVVPIEYGNDQINFCKPMRFRAQPK